ncbi:MAG: sigma-70 family RNA polymerase sigma factor [Candidatus Abyssubacteria bacterium]
MISDNELIARFRAGDRAAFDELVTRYQRRVYATARRMVGHDEVAEDIAQETFVRVFKNLRAFKERSSFTTWLYRITMNLCYDELKRRRDVTEHDPAVELAVVDSAARRMEQEERMQWLEREIMRLPLKQRSVLILRIFHDMSFKEVAKAAGCSANSAKVNYRHAIVSLRKSLAKSGEAL